MRRNTAYASERQEREKKRDKPVKKKKIQVDSKRVRGERGFFFFFKCERGLNQNLAVHVKKHNKAGIGGAGVAFGPNPTQKITT